MTSPQGLFINGKWLTHTSGPTLAVHNPATEELIAELPTATPTDIQLALTSAAAAFTTWQRTDAWTRARLLQKISALLQENAPALGRLLTLEQGKPLAEAVGEVRAAAEQFEWQAEEARRIYGQVIPSRSPDQRSFVIYQPVGVVAAFTPWNFPALLPARKIAAALAAGCSLILKPAEDCPLIAMAMAEICQQAGLPDGVLSLLVGDPGGISSSLISSPIVKKISFTGSVPVGKHLAGLAAQSLKKMTLELGGHAPLIVFEDANIPQAAKAAARGKFRNNGQVCIAPSRFFIQEKVFDELLAEFILQTKKLRLGNGLDPATDLGPMASQRGLARADGLVTRALQEGGRLETGGRRPEGFAKGYFYEPTVLTGLGPDSDLFTTEPFGPIAPLVTFNSWEELVPRVNHPDLGLAAYLFTQNIHTAFTVSEALEVGMVGVNTMAIGGAEIPFGGIKESGFGREGGALGIYEYLQTKSIQMKL